MTDYICPRCQGRNISNDMCIACGEYIAPLETVRFVRSGKEAPQRHEQTEEEKAEKAAMKRAKLVYMNNYYARHRDDEGFLEKRREKERARYAQQKDDPDFIKRRREKYKAWAYRKKLEREAARVASA